MGSSRNSDRRKKTITRRDFLKMAGTTPLLLSGSGMLLGAGNMSCSGGSHSQTDDTHPSESSDSEPDDHTDNNPDRTDNTEYAVYLVKNGDCFQNIQKLWQLMDSSALIGKDDVVVIKANGQWPNQGYTHTGCIKAVIDEILAIPSFSGEILICDNVQGNGVTGATGFDATSDKRTHNWPDYNWNELAAYYQSLNKPVAVKAWINGNGISHPSEGEGWVRYFFNFHGDQAYFSYPVFESPLRAGRMIDMKNGVWENGAYTGRMVKAIYMPTLNNHGSGGVEDYAGVTSAIKCFFGATEIHNGEDCSSGRLNGYANVHTASFSCGAANGALYAGELAALYIKTMYRPVLYITTAMWSGHESRTGGATETKTVLACTNPATLDYIACREVIGKINPSLDPEADNNTRNQIIGCINGGVGTITDGSFSLVRYDFNA